MRRGARSGAPLAMRFCSAALFVVPSRFCFAALLLCRRAFVLPHFCFAVAFLLCRAIILCAHFLFCRAIFGLPRFSLCRRTFALPRNFWFAALFILPRAPLSPLATRQSGGRKGRAARKRRRKGESRGSDRVPLFRQGRGNFDKNLFRHLTYRPARDYNIDKAACPRAAAHSTKKERSEKCWQEIFGTRRGNTCAATGARWRSAR